MLYPAELRGHRLLDQSVSPFLNPGKSPCHPKRCSFRCRFYSRSELAVEFSGGSFLHGRGHGADTGRGSRVTLILEWRNSSCAGLGCPPANSDDAAAGDAFGHLPHQYLADEITSERDRIDRQLRTRARWMATLMPARFQSIRSTH
jgi:hypothetical protein